MNVREIITTKDTINSGRLYRIVFATRYTSIVVAVLLCSFLLQPIDQLYADELIDSGTAEENTPVITEALPDVAVSADTIGGNDEQIVIPSRQELNSDELIEVATNDASIIVTTTTEIVESPSGETSSELSIVSEELIEETIAEYTGTLPTDSTETQTGADASGNITSELVAPPIIEETPVNPNSTTTPVTESAIAISTVSREGVIQFDKSDCVTVADGSFYCQPKKSAEELAADGLFALPDRDGDLEIYIQNSGELSQLTFNEYDDAAPFYDSTSNSIVWHRLVNDRYQIVLYDLETSEEEFLTSDTVNNMEPTRAGKYTVWQRWSGDNWDIVLHDGTNAIILTTALEHDIAPKIRGSLVVWNRLSFDRTQTIELYDIETGEYTSVSDTEGGSISNPRMVLVYESTFANGDIVTKGYDIETGEITPLSATPVEIPVDIPEPDSTGETRALIQGKNTTKEEAEVFDYGTTTPTGGGEPPDSTASSSSSVVLSQATTTFASLTTVAEELTIDLRPVTTVVISSNDLSVPVFTDATTTTTEITPIQ